MKIDVTIASRNNQDTIEKVLKSIQKYLPYNNIILIDDSNDKTPEIARNFGAQVYRVEGRLGQKRIMQAKLATTEWIACIDSDVVLYPNWFAELHRYIKDNKVSSCSGHLESSFSNSFSVYQNYMRFCSGFRMRLTNRLGAMSNVLMRRDCLLSCETHLQNVHAGEDTVIGRILKNQGYHHVLINNTVGFHWHKDAFAHHRMAYRRAGESAGMVRNLLDKVLITIRFLLLQVTQLTLFSIKTMSFESMLIRYMYYLSLLYLSGLHNSEQIRDHSLSKIIQIEKRLIKIENKKTTSRDT
jgi:glycosyltransferase involved in cell wall biosynthesis